MHTTVAKLTLDIKNNMTAPNLRYVKHFLKTTSKKIGQSNLAKCPFSKFEIQNFTSWRPAFVLGFLGDFVRCDAIASNQRARSPGKDIVKFTCRLKYDRFMEYVKFYHTYNEL